MSLSWHRRFLLSVSLVVLFILVKTNGGVADGPKGCLKVSTHHYTMSHSNSFIDGALKSTDLTCCILMKIIQTNTFRTRFKMAYLSLASYCNWWASLDVCWYSSLPFFRPPWIGTRHGTVSYLLGLRRVSRTSYSWYLEIWRTKHLHLVYALPRRHWFTLYLSCTLSTFWGPRLSLIQQ